MRKTVLAISLTTLLSACGPPSVEDYIGAPEMLAEAIDECTIEAAQGKVASEKCRNVQEATAIVGQNLMRSMLPEPLRRLFMSEESRDRQQ